MRRLESFLFFQKEQKEDKYRFKREVLKILKDEKLYY